MSKKLLILTAPFDALAGEYRYASHNTPTKEGLLLSVKTLHLNPARSFRTYAHRMMSEKGSTLLPSQIS